MAAFMSELDDVVAVSSANAAKLVVLDCGRRSYYDRENIESIRVVYRSSISWVS